MPRRKHLETDCSSHDLSSSSSDCGQCKPCQSESDSSSADCEKLPVHGGDIDKYLCGMCPREGSCSSSSSSSSSSSCDTSRNSIIVPILDCKYQKQCEWVDKVKEDSSSEGCSSSSSSSSSSAAVCGDCAYPHHHCKCEDVHGRTFTITYESKVGHPWEHRITTSTSCLAVSEKIKKRRCRKRKGGDIHLTRGHTYRFVVNPDGLLADQDFYFTHDVQGGPKGQCADSPNYDPVPLPGTSAPVASGVVILKVDSSLPKHFFYQSKMNRCCGGNVYVHDK